MTDFDQLSRDLAHEITALSHLTRPVMKTLPPFCDTCGLCGCAGECTVSPRPREDATTEARQAAAHPPQPACPHGTPWATWCADCEYRPRGGTYYNHERWAP